MPRKARHAVSCDTYGETHQVTASPSAGGAGRVSVPLSTSAAPAMRGDKSGRDPRKRPPRPRRSLTPPERTPPPPPSTQPPTTATPTDGGERGRERRRREVATGARPPRTAEERRRARGGRRFTAKAGAGNNLTPTRTARAGRPVARVKRRGKCARRKRRAGRKPTPPPWVGRVSATPTAPAPPRWGRGGLRRRFPICPHTAGVSRRVSDAKQARAEREGRGVPRRRVPSPT